MATPTKNEVANKKNNVDNNIEILRVQPTNNPGMTLVLNPFNGTSFLAWSRLVRITLGAKMELGLSECYDHIPNQILMMDPLSSVTKAYAMVLHVEKQREVSSGITGATQNMAMQVKGFDPRKAVNFKNPFKGKGTLYKRSLVCVVYEKTGHLKDTCFEIHEYPDWYKSLMEQRKKDKTSFSRAFCAEESKISKEESVQNMLDNNNDYKNRSILAVGKGVGKLYVLDDSSFKQETINKFQQHLESVALNVQTEPKTFQQANRKQEWVKAMKSEIDALEQNYTWEVTPLPKDKRDIECRWIFKLKLKSHGTIGRQKVRLVAKGYNQIEGIDYFDTFSPVAKAVTVRTLLVVAASLQWHIHQVDINNAFLHGYIEEEVYMMPPKGYSVPPGHVSKLRRSLYGLKHISRQWNVEFTSKLETYGFHQSKHDHCLYTKSGTSSIMLLLVYVDVILLAGPSEQLISEVKLYLHKEFTIKDLGAVRYFLGLEISRSREGI
ncbi:UNVERIFIED_CONTAM: Retrovirus-related Pol polyprotein from transposon TNT 1-94 [Sesamum radiatum]|uniref:Retrovirus-related Pol polyprotein from transposon TNT 1-94 n=1 Tax=Sesamum radiatum TaxID=300843 RepID=A0AAW2KU39_SESRA